MVQGAACQCLVDWCASWRRHGTHIVSGGCEGAIHLDDGPRSCPCVTLSHGEREKGMGGRYSGDVCHRLWMLCVCIRGAAIALCACASAHCLVMIIAPLTTTITIAPHQVRHHPARHFFLCKYRIADMLSVPSLPPTAALSVACALVPGALPLHLLQHRRRVGRWWTQLWRRAHKLYS